MSMLSDWLGNAAGQMVHISLEMAPFVVLGLLAAAVVYAFIPKDGIERLLGRRGPGSVLKAALIGVPLPLCSCGVVPTALSLKKRGASDGATVSFLVSTPETGVDSIAVTYALINPAMTILRPVAAFVSAVVTGLGVELAGPRAAIAAPVQVEACVVCGDHDCATNHSWRSRLIGSVRYVFNDFFPDIANWLILGLVLSGVLAAILPEDVFVGATAAGQMLAALAVGIPLYICASASTPIAAVLLAKGMSPGAALVFLLVGPATNLASLLVLWRLLGRRTTAIYLLGIIVSSLAIGLLVNATLTGLNWTPNIADPARGEHHSIWQWLGLAVFLIAVANVWRKQIARRLARQTPDACR